MIFYWVVIHFLALVGVIALIGGLIQWLNSPRRRLNNSIKRWEELERKNAKRKAKEKGYNID